MDSIKLTLHLMWFLCTLQSARAQCLAEPGIFKYKIRTAENMIYSSTKIIHKGTNVILKTTCSEFTSSTCKINLEWFLLYSGCDNGFAGYDYQKYTMSLEKGRYKHLDFPLEEEYSYRRIIFRESYGNYSLCELQDKPSIAKTKHDGRYMFLLNINSTGCKNPDIDVTVEFQKEHDYLSFSERPLLDFYAVMCAAYVILGMLWFFMFDYQCTDFQKMKMKGLLGITILVGLLEIVLLFMEYQHINSMGTCSATVFYTHMIVSCLRRSAMRMLLMIVSIGYGIIKLNIKPRLHRVFQIGCCYLLFSLIEGYLSVQVPTEQELMACIPLAILDFYICYWIFTSLHGTIKTLRLDVVQHRLYSNFKRSLVNLIFIFMIFLVLFVKERIADCVTNLETLWIYDTYWYILSYVQLVIVIIWWRPAERRYSPFTDYEDQKSKEPLKVEEQ